MATRNQADLWRELVDEAGEDAGLRAGQVTVEQAERELTAEGFDVAKERAEAADYLRALEANEAQVGANGERPSDARAWTVRIGPTPIRRRTPSTRWVWWVTGILVLVTLGGALYALARRPNPVDLPRPAMGPKPL